MSQSLSIRKSAWTGILAKAAMVLPVLVIPKFLIPLLGPERFGIVLTILSLVSFLSLCDLGIGSSLITKLSHLLGEKRYSDASQIQSNGYIVICFIASLLFLFSIALFDIDIGCKIFPRSDKLVQAEASKAIAAMVMMFAICTPLTLASKIQFAFNQGHISNLWQILAAMLNFVFGCASAFMDLGIVGVVIGLSIGNLICGLANTYFYISSNKKCEVRLRLLSINTCKVLIRDSSSYLVIQLIYLITYGLDSVLVARGLGASEAARYALADRFFGTIAIATTVVTLPLWAVYGNLNATQQKLLAFHTLKKWTLRISFIAAVMSIFIAIFLNPVILYLSSKSLMISMYLAFAMAAWRVVESVGASISVYLYTINKVSIVMFLGFVTAGTSLLCKIFLLPQIGSISMPLSTLACFVIFCLIPCSSVIKKSVQSAIS